MTTGRRAIVGLAAALMGLLVGLSVGGLGFRIAYSLFPPERSIGIFGPAPFVAVMIGAALVGSLGAVVGVAVGLSGFNSSTGGLAGLVLGSGVVAWLYLVAPATNPTVWTNPFAGGTILLGAAASGFATGSVAKRMHNKA